MNSGRFTSGDPKLRLPKTAEHRAAIAEGQRRAWTRGRTGGGYGTRERLPVGTKSVNRDGYVMVKIAPGKGKWRAEHSLKMEKRLGRPLVPPEMVHHVDLNRSNNADENLYLCKDMSEHNDVHRSLDAAVRKLVAAGILKFKDGTYEAIF